MSRNGKTKTKQPVYPVTEGAQQALYAGALAACMLLVEIDPPRGSREAKALAKLAAGIERFEKQRYPISADEVKSANQRLKGQR